MFLATTHKSVSAIQMIFVQSTIRAIPQKHGTVVHRPVQNATAALERARARQVRLGPHYRKLGVVPESIIQVVIPNVKGFGFGRGRWRRHLCSVMRSAGSRIEKRKIVSEPILVMENGAIFAKRVYINLSTVALLKDAHEIANNV